MTLTDSLISTYILLCWYIYLGRYEMDIIFHWFCNSLLQQHDEGKRQPEKKLLGSLQFQRVRIHANHCGGLSSRVLGAAAGKLHLDPEPEAAIAKWECHELLKPQSLPQCDRPYPTSLQLLILPKEFHQPRIKLLKYMSLWNPGSFTTRESLKTMEYLSPWF